ncbi:asparagine synthetase [Fictibacillus macauensis ZFHKF-1]|uniref:asparagine synthase (glutamine-hydrolyzing) n=1 Tax=Fictibacillus macauensis ZFHKF-1 TaxID=1196324 RepID=I8IYK4_9BACL|nr:asparagine synthase (glutamine-hydrolyzing) [Fictibacillus macauensis]EIT84551.1 asparagine synthetase [Fictibacillus macauensis ZFHKF-1]
MCGITGWVDYTRNIGMERQTVLKMAQTLTKRGPDALNVWTGTHAGFGHARLAVVDLLGGAQPMVRNKQEHQYVICYNGELYNTEEVRHELRKFGWTFEGHSDTEVLLLAYMQWQEQCLHKLNGIFAFAIWDETAQTLFLARDRLGVKPLFYRKHENGLLFGSELKALLAHHAIKAEVHQEGLQEIFGLGPSRTPGNGVFRGMEELRPGHYLQFTSRGLHVKRYWNVQSKTHEHSFEDTVWNVKHLVSDAVERQLVADVPVCTFLSGGLDSSLITSIAATSFATHSRGQLHTFSIDYKENDQYFQANDFQPDADGPWIQRMTDSSGTLHHYCEISNEELADHLQEAVRLRDLPGMADVDSSLIWFCRHIKKQSTVALSGECADEIFGGYPWFHKPEVMNRPLFPWMSSTKEREALLRPEWSRKLDLASYVKQRYDESVQETPLLAGETGIEEKRRQIFYLNMQWFMATLLDRKDRMSMGASLEVRVPFADHRIVEYAWNIPWDMKMLDGREKGLLRKAFTGTLPNDVLYRKKSPYPKTHHPLYTTYVKNWLQQILTNKNAPLFTLLQRERIQEIVDSDGRAFTVPWFGQLMTGPQLMAHLAQINYWLESYNVNILE